MQRNRGKQLRSSLPNSRVKSMQEIIEEASARDNGVITVENDGENNLEQQPLDRLECDCFLDPCLEFSFKTLRGDLPVEANNLASQSYNHHQQASINVGYPGFCDHAYRQT